jgi:hypothetical protein
MATDIPNPTALDEAIWALYLAMAEGDGPYLRPLATAAKALFPNRYRREYERRNPTPYDPSAARRRRAANPEAYREYSRRWSAANREQQHAITKAWYERNRDRALARQRERLASDPDAHARRRGYEREWQIRNPGRVAEYHRSSRVRRLPEVREYEREYARRWRAEHREQYNERMRAYRAQRRAA